MRLIWYVLGGVLCICAGSAAAIPQTIDKTDDVSGDLADHYIDGDSVTRMIEFFGSDFSGQALSITDFQIGFSFLKSLNSGYRAPDESAAISGADGPFLNDIQLEVTSPSGTTVILVLDDASGLGNGSFDDGTANTFFRGTVIFDRDVGNQPVNFDRSIFPASLNAVPGPPAVPGPGDPVPTGDSYNSADNTTGLGLDEFLALDPVGDWSYRVSDSFAGGDGISLYGVTIAITTESLPSNVPEPGTLMLVVGAAFAGGAASRRRRRKAT